MVMHFKPSLTGPESVAHPFKGGERGLLSLGPTEEVLIVVPVDRDDAQALIRCLAPLAGYSLDAIDELQVQEA